MAVPDAVRRAVWARASSRCEYCRMRQAWEPFHRYHVEHIVARQHHGDDELENLALACNHCNRRKGPNLTGVDPDGSATVPLFHPRTESWADHFKLDAGRIAGVTITGRTTVFLLEMNAPRRVELRSENSHEW